MATRKSINGRTMRIEIQVDELDCMDEVSLLRGVQDAADRWFGECVATGLEADPDEPWEAMSEYQLAEWRLGR